MKVSRVQRCPTVFSGATRVETEFGHIQALGFAEELFGKVDKMLMRGGSHLGMIKKMDVSVERSVALSCWSPILVRSYMSSCFFAQYAVK